ncbi:MAG: MarR family transcriptional regulator [Coxiellaceae bacterium]|nr:MAG: MarR family transcriptional regulator [Coxiellaceae bacterium]
MTTKYQGTPLEINALNAFITQQRAANAVATRLSQQLAELNLTPGQFGALEALLHLGPLNQSQLAKKLLSTKGNITLIIDNLEKRNLVKREVDTQDRRLTIVHLTAMGTALIQRIFPDHVAAIVKIFSVLTPEELQVLQQLSKKLGLSLSR